MTKPKPKRSDSYKFAERYEIVTETGCWIWTGHLRIDGYGMFVLDRKPTRAHRASWELHVGPIPDKALVIHRCDVPACVNPAHLRLGTNDENMADMVAKGRQAKGPRIRNSMFTEDQVRAIRADNRSDRKSAV